MLPKLFFEDIYGKENSLKEFEKINITAFMSNSEIKQYNNLVFVNIKDNWTYEDANSIINEIDLNHKDMTIMISTLGRELYKTEKYLHYIVKKLKSKNINFYVFGIPPCYTQDYNEKNYDMFTFNKFKLYFSNYKYYEDCKFCKLRSNCPGALEKFENQVFAAFKDSSYDYDPPELKYNENIEFDKFYFRLIKGHLKLWFLPLFEINENEIEKIKNLLIKLRKFIQNPEFFIGNPGDDNQLLNSISDLAKTISFEKRFTYKSSSIEDSFSPKIKLPVEFDIYDSIIILTKKEYFTEDFIKKLVKNYKELTEKGFPDEKIYNLIKYKLHLIIKI